MAEHLKQMKGDEFVAKLLAGERDFRRIKLEEGYKGPVGDGYSKLNTYFHENTNDFIENPLKLFNADFSHVFFGGFNFSHAKAREVKFEKSEFLYCRFKSADLQSANFYGARLVKADFSDAKLISASFLSADLTSAYLLRTDLTQADFESARLREATFAHANVFSARFRDANLYKADLLFVHNLDQAIGLSSAHFLETKVDRKDLPTLKRALKKRKDLIYTSFFEHYFGDK